MRTLLMVAALALGETCGLEEGTKNVGEPCTRNEECASGLRCRGGVCQTPPDAGDDAS